MQYISYYESNSTGITETSSRPQGLMKVVVDHPAFVCTIWGSSNP